MRVGSVEIIVENVPHVVHAVESNSFSTIYKPKRIHGNNATRYGNNRLPPIDVYMLRMLGKILFVIVLLISGSCQSMLYRSVIHVIIYCTGGVCDGVGEGATFYQ